MLPHEHGLSGAKPNLAKVAGARLTPGRVKQARERAGLTRSQFGKAFRDQELVNGYSRNYISMIERGKVPLTERFEQKFYRVREVLRANAQAAGAPSAVELELVSAHPLKMKRLEILARPRKCDGCGRWFVPVQSGQKRHNDKRCHARAARKRRRCAAK